MYFTTQFLTNEAQPSDSSHHSTTISSAHFPKSSIQSATFSSQPARRSSSVSMFSKFGSKSHCQAIKRSSSQVTPLGNAHSPYTAVCVWMIECVHELARHNCIASVNSSLSQLKLHPANVKAAKDKTATPNNQFFFITKNINKIKR
jgi:hypothetical protein